MRPEKITFGEMRDEMGVPSRWAAVGGFHP
jgi:hypothetical protein